MISLKKLRGPLKSRKRRPPIGYNAGSMDGNENAKSNRLLYWLRPAIWTYLACVVLSWLLLILAGDRWWPATLLLFGPRWLLSLPMVVLAPAAAWMSRRHLIPLLVAAVLLFGPVMGFNFSLPQDSDAGRPIRVLTCNVGGPEIDYEKLRRLIEDEKPDIVTLQECPEPLAKLVLGDWTMLQKERIVIASQYAITEGGSRQAMHPPHKWPRLTLLQSTIETPVGELSFCAVHLPSPRYGLATILDRRVGLNLTRLGLLKQEQELRRDTSREIESLVRKEPLPVIVAGDFNMPADSVWYRRSWSDYSNAFSEAGFGYGLTEQVEIGGFKYKVRIDHILARGALRSLRCRVGPDIGSDHLPVIADIAAAAEPAP